MRVVFPPHLRRFVDLPESCEASGNSLIEIIDHLEQQFPGFRGWLLHENGQLRQHVNIFLDERLLSDRQGLAEPVSDVHEITIMQALSGG